MRLLAHHLVASADGTRLAVYRSARAERAIVLLVHGWAQSAACFRRQLHGGPLARRYLVAATDLRGHGASDVAAGGYGDPAVWAADLSAVLGALPELPVVLVGWSYGGLVIADFIAGAALPRPGRVVGVVLVGAITGIGRGQRAGRVGPAMRAALPAALDEDPAVAVPALTSFVGAMAPGGLRGEDAQRLIGTSLGTPPWVRAALFDRVADGAAFARAAGEAGLPVLVLHGTDDPVVDRSAAEHHLATIPGARADWWAGHGHLPFLEDECRFAAAVDAFTARCLETGGLPT
ncbi:MAG TPA: alpha/beta hydrolase [Pseudonocardiaceae bacterium]|nr:alpha/beta hydrolase [Pseudonocardiaceae bacterium]